MLTQDQEKMLAQIGELVADCIRIGVEQERARCAKIAAGEICADDAHSRAANVIHQYIMSGAMPADL